jgi:hypothetical protein
MKAFMTTGAHRSAMPHLLNWCDEASLVHWEQSEPSLTSWPEADRRLRAEGRPSKVRFPSVDHGPMTFAHPRPAAVVPIKARKYTP